MAKQKLIGGYIIISASLQVGLRLSMGCILPISGLAYC